jgi:hypothetical protein
MKKIIEHDEKCKACDGTGIYVGMAERDGAGVVCRKCEGTGCFHYKYEYEEFTGRKDRIGVEQVYQTNPGIVVGKGKGKFELSDFGGIPYRQWLDNEVFPAGSEMREFTCPCWWYQSADYSKKPDWEECWSSLGSSFSQCKYFGEKEKCWVRWDEEIGSLKPKRSIEFE